jgi:hypothetical protein
MAQRRGPKPRNDFDDGSPEDSMGRRFARRQVSEMQAEDESSLFYIIRNGKASLQVISIYSYFCGGIKKQITGSFFTLLEHC